MLEGERFMARNTRLIYWAAGLSILALVMHAIDAPDHLSEWWGYGTFFVIIAAFQFFFGFFLLIQPWRYDSEGSTRDNAGQYGRPYFVLGAVLSTLIILVYIVTRITGMFFLSPEAIVEPVTPLSLLPVVENVPLLFCHIVLIYRAGNPVARHLKVS
jgi:hypothetical protein